MMKHLLPQCLFFNSPSFRILPRRSGWNVYAGGGPALNIYRARGNSDAEAGFNILLGVQHAGGFFAEIKGGAVDSPNFKLGFGYVFAP